MHAPYTLVARSRKAGKPVYYARFRGPDGERLPWKSTGHTSKIAARRWADAYLKSGLLPGNERITLEELSAKVWDWDGEYIRGKRARGGQIGRSHVAIQAANMRNHVLPVLGKIPVLKLTRAKIEQWQLSMLESDGARSPRTINNMLSALKVVVNYAVDAGVIATSPASAVHKLTQRSQERGVLTPAEARKVLDPRRWTRPDLCLMSLLAAMTGMRMGELQALRIGAVYRDYVDIRESWGRYGVKEPKWNSKRKVPIGSATRGALEDHIQRLANKGADALLFPGSVPRKPVTQKPIDRHLYAAMRAAGILDEERRERRLSFHSLRHFFVTGLQRAGLSEGQIQALSGHTTVKMIALYTHLDTRDFLPAVAAIEVEVGAAR